MTTQKIRKMDKVEDLSLDVIKNALETGADSDDEQVKVAVKMMGVVAKNRQTMTNRSAIEFSMANRVGTDTELKSYVKATNPQIQKAFGKMLPQG